MSSTSSRIFTPLTIILILLLLAAIGTGTYFYLDLTETRDRLIAERTTLISEKATLSQNLSAASSTILALREELGITNEALEETRQDYEEERERNEEFEEEYRQTIETVRDLDKLAQLDEELLQKYSRVYFLNENYIPSPLTEIEEEYILDTRSQEQYFHRNAYPFLEDMLEAAEDDDIDLQVSSAYRSFDTQAELKGQYSQTYGTGANAFSADQGYSEHQLGTTVDLTTTEVNGPYLAFAETEAFAWLEDNAYKYGFVLSYPEDNAFYIFEPWHWRFVGTELADDLHDADAHFYDWEQRKIDTYLLNIFD